MRDHMKSHGYSAADDDHDEQVFMKSHGHRAADGDRDDQVFVKSHGHSGAGGDHDEQMAMKSHGNGAADGDHDEQVFATTFTALNNSGVKGAAALVYDPDSHSLTVEIDATGLEPGQIHPQHIHGFTDGTVSHSPTLAQDTDHDGFVELAEGLATYGPILLNLSTNPDNSTHDHGTQGHDHTNLAEFPTADANGNLHYLETFNFDPNDPNAAAILSSIVPLDQKEIVLHGETVAAGQGAGTDGEVDGTAGYKAVLPVASGEIHAADNHEAHTIIADLNHDAQHSGDHSLSDFLLGHV